MKILYQGHGSLRITTDQGSVMYLDPCAGEGYTVASDVILVTHQHPDHCMVNKPARKAGCTVISNFDLHKDKEYQSVQAGEFFIEAVPAYNSNHRRSECVGYLVSADGVLCYFAGDTSKISEMADLRERNIDYAFFPTDGIFNMDEIEAAECAEIVGARHSIPIHMIPFHGVSGELFSEEKAARFQPAGRMILRPGEIVSPAQYSGN